MQGDVLDTLQGQRYKFTVPFSALESQRIQELLSQEARSHRTRGIKDIAPVQSLEAPRRVASACPHEVEDAGDLAIHVPKAMAA